MAVQTGPHDVQDGDDEQDGEGHIGTDEGGGEGRSHDVEGRRGGMGQRSEEDGEGAGESREHEGVQAERPDAGRERGYRSCVTSGGSPVSQTMPLVNVVWHAPSVTHCRSYLPCVVTFAPKECIASASQGVAVLRRNPCTT